MASPPHNSMDGADAEAEAVNTSVTAGTPVAMTHHLDLRCPRGMERSGAEAERMSNREVWEEGISREREGCAPTKQ